MRAATTKSGIRTGFAGILLLLFCFLAAGCDSDSGPSLYDPDGEETPAPGISSISPENESLAGVGLITINGQNFSSNPAENLVYFNATRAEIVEASPTSLVVKAPNLPGAGLAVKVSVLGARQYSNTMPYTLLAVAEPFGSIANFEEPFALASDPEGNLYVSLFSNNVSAGIKKIAPDGTRSDYVSTTFKWDGLARGPQGALYGVRNVRAVFRFAAAGSTQETWAVIPDNAARLIAVETDASGNVWVGGTGGNLYRITPDVNITAIPFAGSVRALNLFEDYLYVAAVRGNAGGIWRLPVSGAGEAGPVEEYVLLPAGVTPLSMAFAANGDLLLGTDAADPMLVVSPDRTAAPLYPGVLNGTAISLAWGTGSTLYMTRGRTDTVTPNIIRINTLRERGN